MQPRDAVDTMNFLLRFLGQSLGVLDSSYRALRTPLDPAHFAHDGFDHSLRSPLPFRNLYDVADGETLRCSNPRKESDMGEGALKLMHPCLIERFRFSSIHDSPDCCDEARVCVEGWQWAMEQDLDGATKEMRCLG